MYYISLVDNTMSKPDYIYFMAFLFFALYLYLLGYTCTYVHCRLRTAKYCTMHLGLVNNTEGDANFSHSTAKSPVELRAAIEMRKKAIINGGGGRGDGEWGYWMTADFRQMTMTAISSYPH